MLIIIKYKTSSSSEKNVQILQIEGYILNHIQGIYQKPTAKILLTGDWILSPWNQSLQWQNSNKNDIDYKTKCDYYLIL